MPVARFRPATIAAGHGAFPPDRRCFPAARSGRLVRRGSRVNFRPSRLAASGTSNGNSRMTQVANCPQCNQHLVVPDESNPEAWARCPECREFFQLKDAAARELPAAVVVDFDPGNADYGVESKPTIKISRSGKSGDAPGTESESEAPREPADETPVDSSQSSDDLEEAAERIDKWFRSAKTLADLPEKAGDARELSSERANAGALDEIETGAAIEIGASALDGTGAHDDFDLEVPTDSPESAATWDDPQRMESLLADIEVSPSDEFVAATEQTMDDDDRHDAQPAGATPVDASNFVPPIGAKRRKKRSLARTLLMAVVAGFVGSGLGYYALLWLRGTDGDFLNLARYLPKMMLPGEFQAAPRQVAVNVPQSTPPQVEPAELATDPPKTSTPPPVEDTAEVPAEPVDEPAEEQASFTTPAEPVAPPADEDDRYATTTGDAETPPAEPAPLDEPAAAPLTEEVAAIESVSIDNSPTFTADELAAALDAAKDAQPKLVEGRFSDGREVQRAKGFSYSLLADLAQKATFVDAKSNPESAANSQAAAEELFRQTFADDKTRSEVALILPKWITSPNRKHGGAFFAATLTNSEKAGTVVECTAELEGGQSLQVLVPPALADRLGDSSRPLAVVGWIVDQPAEHVAGYTGSAPQAIWAGNLISLE